MQLREANLAYLPFSVDSTKSMKQSSMRFFLPFEKAPASFFWSVIAFSSELSLFFFFFWMEDYVWVAWRTSVESVKSITVCNVKSSSRDPRNHIEEEEDRSPTLLRSHSGQVCLDQYRFMEPDEPNRQKDRQADVKWSEVKEGK
jgi:hypothetical protein